MQILEGVCFLEVCTYVYEIGSFEPPSLEQVKVEEFDALITNAPCEFQGSRPC